jgi:multicomponent Na+:H+ antiporter subunit A
MLPAVLSGFVLALAAPRLYRLAGRGAGWLFALLPLGLALWFGSFFPQIAAGERLRFSTAWVPALGIELSFLLDGLSLLFLLLITGVGALILIYSGDYLKGHPQLGRFYAYLLFFFASMVGLVLADNVIVLFVFWELTSLSSYLLIGFDHERPAARAGALQALLVTALGGQALLAGLLLLANAAGSQELSTIILQAGLTEHPLYLPVLLLILAGAFTKSAQFPFHFWLPNAMEAPAPVSAYLHSSTMVKAGVYLVARLSPVLGGSDAWFFALVPAGAATMLLGAFLAYRQSLLKPLLAYSTVSVLGTLMLLLGVGTEFAVWAAVVFLLAHALYKGALFLVAGSLDHETGERDAERLSGLWSRMPFTALAALLAAVSMAGGPPLFGFVSKELVYESLQEAPRAPLVLLALAVLANVWLVAAAVMAGIKPFAGKTRAPGEPHEAPPGMLLGPMVLALTGVALGAMPALLPEPLLAPGVTAILGRPVPKELAIWHGFNVVLALGAATLLAGAAAFSARAGLRRLASRLDVFSPRGPEALYGAGLDGLNLLARSQTRLLQSGSLRRYLLLVILTSIGLVGYAFLSRTLDLLRLPLAEASTYEIGLSVIILVAALATVRSRTRVGALAAVGIAGYSVALVYAIFSAPDLAITQFVIETLVVVLFVLIIYRLPRFTIRTPWLTRLRDVIVASTAGAIMSGLVLVSTSVEGYETISGYFVEKSHELAHGRNIVNVILVDFRATDTLGEITVLALAGIGVYGLLKLRLE